MNSQTSILSDAELDFVTGGEKNAKGQTVPKKERKPPVDPLGTLGPEWQIPPSDFSSEEAASVGGLTRPARLITCLSSYE